MEIADHINATPETLASRRQEVAGRVISALRELRTIRDKRRKWSDADNEWDESKPGAGAVMMLEGLLCILIPLRSFEDRRAEIYQIFHRNFIETEIRQSFKRLRETNGVFIGDPYIRIVDRSGQEHSFLDVACLALSVIRFAEQTLGLPATSEDAELYKWVFLHSLKIVDGALIRRNNKPAGWFVTDFALPKWHFKYCTWMACDTLSDLASVDEITSKKYFPDEAWKLLGNLNSAVRQMADELARYYFDENGLTAEERASFKGFAPTLNPRNSIVREDNYDDNWPQFNLWLLLTFFFLRYGEGPKGSQQAAQNMFDSLKNLQTWFEVKEGIENITAGVRFRADDFINPNERLADPSKKESINWLDDRAVLPQWAKALSIAVAEHSDWRNHFGADLRSAVDQLLNTTVADGRSVWDDQAKDGFSLYMTERAIEALCKYNDYLERLEQELRTSRQGGIAPATALVGMTDPGLKEVLERLVAKVSQYSVTINVQQQDAEKLIEGIVKKTLDERLKAETDSLHKALRESLSSHIEAQSKSAATTVMATQSEQIKKISSDIADATQRFEVEVNKLRNFEKRLQELPSAISKKALPSDQVKNIADKVAKNRKSSGQEG